MRSVKGGNFISVLIAVCAYAFCICASIGISVLTYGNLWLAVNQFSASGLLIISLFAFSSFVSGVVAARLAVKHRMLMAATTGLIIGVLPAIVHELIPHVLNFGTKSTHIITVILLFNSLGPIIGAIAYLKIFHSQGVRPTEQGGCT